jgi:peptidoglycan/xylan/chitin deacetylase (PgdA/CDA1 family)
MILLHRIGKRLNSNFNTLSEILDLPKDQELSFDGIYDSVFGYAPYLKDRKVTLFVMGKYVGATNNFDIGQPQESFLTWPDIFMLRDEYGFEIGYHSWSHRNLKTLSDAEVLQEVLPPFPMCRFAYPYGDVDERVATIVRNAGYQEAWSVTQGDGSQFQRKRRYLNW